MPNRLLLALGLTAVCTSAQAAETSRYVQGSWVNVRSAAAADAPVLTQLTVNTPVRVLREAGRFCEVRFGAEQSGFIACNLLGPRALQLADVEPGLDDKGQPKPGGSPQRAFWIAPTIPRLLGAGESFRVSLLSAEQRRAEEPPEPAAYESTTPAPRLVRFPVPEFEAMKELLRRGVVAGADAAAAHADWSSSVKAGLPLRADIAALVLPERPRTPSLFRRQGDLASPVAGVDDLSARFGVPEHLRVLKGPRWGVYPGREFFARFSGAWDIGAYEAWLGKPVIEHTLARDGRLGAGETTLRHQVTLGEAERCGSEPWLPRAERHLRDRPHVKEPLALFYTATALPFTQTRIASRGITLPRLPKADDGRNFERATTYRVDLDGDGVDDLVVIELNGIGPMSGEPTLLLRVLVANIAGAWAVVASEAFEECT